MDFLSTFYLFSCDCYTNDNGTNYIITLIDSNGNKHRVYVEKNVFDYFEEFPVMEKIENVPVSIYQYTKGDKAGAYGLNIDLRGAINEVL